MKFSKHSFYTLVLLIISTGFVWVFNVNYSPLFSDCYLQFHSGSSIEAIIIGKYWNATCIPYKDLFGISGPLVYLLGLLSWNMNLRIGGFILQIAILFFICYMLFGFFNYYNNKLFSLCLSLIFIPLFLGVFAYGDLEAELSFIIVLTIILLVLRWDFYSPPVCYLFIGMLLGMALTTNISTFIACLFVFIGFLFQTIQKEEKYKYLFVFTGFLSIILPFVLYFLFHNAISDVLLAYRLQMQFLLSGLSTTNEIVRKLIKCFPLILYLTLSIKLKRKATSCCTIYVCIAIGLLISTFFSNVTWNKCGLIIISIYLCIDLLLKQFHFDKPRCKQLFITGIIILSYSIYSIPIYSYLSKYQSYCLSKEYTNINNIINILDTNKEILMVDLPAEYYLYLDQKPAYKFFTKQSELSVSESFISSNVSSFVENCNIPWLLLNGKGGVPFEIASYYLVSIIDNEIPIAVYEQIE